MLPVVFLSMAFRIGCRVFPGLVWNCSVIVVNSKIRWSLKIVLNMYLSGLPSTLMSQFTRNIQRDRAMFKYICALRKCIHLAGLKPIPSCILRLTLNTCKSLVDFFIGSQSLARIQRKEALCAILLVSSVPVSTKWKTSKIKLSLQQFSSRLPPYLPYCLEKITRQSYMLQESSFEGWF